MDATPEPELDATDGDLGDGLRARVKAELDLGERLLWAARPEPRPDRLSGPFVFWVAADALAGLTATVCLATTGLGPRGPTEGPVSLGLLSGAFALAVTLVPAAVVTHRRAERVRKAGTLYALTDRRAIIWVPAVRDGAVTVHTIPRGRVGPISRTEYPDGSGDVTFVDAGEAELAWNPPLRLPGRRRGPTGRGAGATGADRVRASTGPREMTDE